MSTRLTLARLRTTELRSAVAAAAAAAGMPAPPVAPVALQQLDAQLQGVASALRSKRALLAAGGVGSRAGVAEAARHAGAAAGGAGSAGSGGARRQRGASALAAAGAQPPSAEASLGEHLKPGFTSGGAVATARNVSSCRGSALTAACADADVDRAATLLRVLYLEDLRQLQTQVNSLIEQAQVRAASACAAAHGPLTARRRSLQPIRRPTLRWARWGTSASRSATMHCCN